MRTHLPSRKEVDQKIAGLCQKGPSVVARSHRPFHHLLVLEKIGLCQCLQRIVTRFHPCRE